MSRVRRRPRRPVIRALAVGVAFALPSLILLLLAG